jgi:uncharacterized protein (TIGR02145 family)
MKKTLLILSLLLSVVLVSAQSDYGKFAYGFGMAEGQVGKSSFVMGMPFFKQYGTDTTVCEGVMHAQLQRLDIVLEGCQNDSLVVSPSHVQDSSGFMMEQYGVQIVFKGETITVFPVDTTMPYPPMAIYDSTSYDAGHYSWNAQFNYDSLTTLLLKVHPIYEIFDTLYLDSNDIRSNDYAIDILHIDPDTIAVRPLHGGPNEYDWNTVTYGCDSIRHYFVNLCGGTVKDADGYEYASLYIGTAPARYCWTKPNMKSTHYIGGAEAPNMIYKSYSFSDTTENLDIYGRLYNWYAAVNVPEGSDAQPKKTLVGGYVRGICPAGWHLPDSANVQSLATVDAFDLMSDILWLIPGHDTGTGFYALPAGFYHHVTDRFEDMLGYTVFWSSVKHSLTECWVCSLAFGCNKFINDDMSAENGASIRCVKDQVYDEDGTELTDLEP